MSLLGQLALGTRSWVHIGLGDKVMVTVSYQSWALIQSSYCRCDSKWQWQRWRNKLAGPVWLRYRASPVQNAYRAALYGATSCSNNSSDISEHSEESDNRSLTD